MELYVLNKDMQAIHLLDTFESLLWTERYYECGDFEISSPASIELLKTFEKENYLWSKDSDTVMIIEDLEISSDQDKGTLFSVTGRSLESILERRIVWNPTVLTGNLQDGIEKLLNENVISPTIQERKIENFLFERSADEQITKLTVGAEYDGDNLYEVIQTLCKTNSVGFKVVINDKNQFIFKLYAGVDRSYNQNEVPYVLFSQNSITS